MRQFSGRVLQSNGTPSLTNFVELDCWENSAILIQKNGVQQGGKSSLVATATRAPECILYWCILLEPRLNSVLHIWILIHLFVCAVLLSS